MSAPTPALYTLSLHDALPISRSRQASGSGRGASCSERIRDECGQGTAILDIELIQLGDGVVVRRATPAGRGERAPDDRLGGRHGKLAHDARVEPPEAAARGIGAQPGQSGEDPGV